MVRAFVGFILAALPPVLFVAYCRLLLLRASKTELSTAVLEAIAAESERLSGEDFHRLQVLVGLCPLDQKDRIPLATLSLYFVLLTGLHTFSLRICGVIANWTERERQRCSHFVAVKLDQRIARARKLVSEQMDESDR
jgi:hypothetical protein